jgi:hypothetical protein
MKGKKIVVATHTNEAVRVACLRTTELLSSKFNVVLDTKVCLVLFDTKAEEARLESSKLGPLQRFTMDAHIDRILEKDPAHWSNYRKGQAEKTRRSLHRNDGKLTRFLWGYLGANVLQTGQRYESAKAASSLQISFSQWSIQRRSSCSDANSASLQHQIITRSSEYRELDSSVSKPKSARMPLGWVQNCQRCPSSIDTNSRCSR